MFIDEIVEKIWEDESRAYFEYYQRALAMDASALVEALSGKRMEFVQHRNNRTNGNLLLTSGCSYRIRSGKLSGCSMCDYHTTNIDGWAMMRALRKKDEALYAAAVRRSMENARGPEIATAFCEQITGNDCLDPMEFPAPVLDELFGERPILSDKPFCYMFEVLPTNVTPERLALFRHRFGDQRRLFFDFGVESTSWLREHWLNKRCSDAAIVRAVETIRAAGYFSMADMLIGIPGLTEEQSIVVFLDTMTWLEEIGVDRVVCLPLNRKETTLQGYLHRRHAENERLASAGLAQGEHTGVPWLFTVLEALCRLADVAPGMYRKLSIAATRPTFVTGASRTAYGARPDCACNDTVVDALEEYQKRHDPSGLFRVRDTLRDHSCYAEYRALVALQRRAGGLADTLRLLASEIARDMFPGDYAGRLARFEDELGELPGIDATR